MKTKHLTPLLALFLLSLPGLAQPTAGSGARARQVQDQVRGMKDASRQQNTDQTTTKKKPSLKAPVRTREKPTTKIAPQIHRNAADGRLFEVTRTVEKQPNLSRERDSQGYTPLHHAALRGHVDIIDVLLKNGAMLNARGTRGETALYLATSAGSTPAVLRLLKAGAKPNRGNASRMTPLHKAASAGNIEMVEALLEAGADPKLKDRRGRTPHDLAKSARRGDHELVLRSLTQALSDK